MRVLVTGSTGLLAKGFCEAAPEGAEVVGVHRRDYALPDARAVHLSADVRDPAAVDALFAGRRFDAVVHAAGVAAVDQAERHPEEARTSNLEGTRNVARAAARAGAYLVYISTNAVFDGTSPPYAEDAPPRPLHHYGRIKLDCERAALEAGGHLCVARPILMYGWNHTVNRPNPVTWVYEKLLRGEALKLVDDVYENPLFNIQCARALWRMIERRPSGVFHLAGATRVNRWELGLEVARAFSLDESLIERVGSSAFPSIAARPPDTTFDTGRMTRELGVEPLTLAQGLAEMRRTMGTSP